MKILISGMSSNYGGIETFLMNYIPGLLSKHEVHLIVYEEPLNVAFYSQLKKLGIKLHKVTSRNIGYWKHKKETHLLLEREKYDVVWMNAVSLSNLTLMEASKKCEVPHRIAHSHSNQNMGGIKTQLLHYINKRKIQKNANYFWACSKEAWDWMFSPTVDPVLGDIIPNAIPFEKYYFSNEKRAHLRHKMNWHNKVVIGHVARLEKTKNQCRLIDIFEEISHIESRSILVIIGDGSMRKNLEDYVKEKGLSSKVFMMGTLENVSDWLSTFDVFLLPSLFEGLGISLIESQVNGLPTFASAGLVSMESKISNKIVYVSLEESNEVWANKILDAVNHSNRERDMRVELEKSPYNMKQAIKNLLSMFEKMEGGN